MTDTLMNLETMDGSGRREHESSERQLTLTLLHHPDASQVGARARLPLLAHVRARAALSRSEPLFRGHGRSAPLTTPFVSRKPLWIEALGGGAVRLDASESGSRVEVDGEPVVGALDVDAERLERGVVVQHGTHVVVLMHLEHAGEVDEARIGSGLIGESEGIREVRAAIAEVAGTSGSVLIRGETGSGKELVAAALHHQSARARGPFVAVNMAAIPPTLAASELFGHQKGAFSGADAAHDGYFVRAHGGSLFLDEVGDTSLEVQAALLRVLETGEVQAVGARQVKKVDVRVIAATDAPLETAVAEGRFRGPLLYRLAHSEIRVPALRERLADIGRLLVWFLRDELAALGRAELLMPSLTEEKPWLPAALVARLCRYAWPGNVRQLRNVARTLAAQSRSGRPLELSEPELERLLPATRARAATSDAVGREADGARGPLEGAPSPRAPSAITPEEVERVLVALDYRLGAAAEWFGISRPSMNELVDKHPRLRRAQRIDADEIRAALREAEKSGLPAWRVLEVSERGLQRRMKELGLE